MKALSEQAVLNCVTAAAAQKTHQNQPGNAVLVRPATAASMPCRLQQQLADASRNPDPNEQKLRALAEVQQVQQQQHAAQQAAQIIAAKLQMAELRLGKLQASVSDSLLCLATCPTVSVGMITQPNCSGPRHQLCC